LAMREDPDFNAKALQFVGAYIFVLIAESALAIFWIKKQ